MYLARLLTEFSELRDPGTSEPHPPGAARAPDDVFRPVAEVLLQRTLLFVQDVPHRIREIEFYAHGPGHPDPFAHCSSLQRSCGRWYFHRQGKSYRGGTFKGLDITFGPEGLYGGILLRSLSHPGGELVCGPSRCVDYLLHKSGRASPAELDRALETRSVFEPGPLRLKDLPPSQPLAPGLQLADETVLSSARVGLTMNRVDRHPLMVRYFGCRYRFLNGARHIKKGRPQLVVALHESGAGARAISEQTGTPPATVKRYVQAYERGRIDGLAPGWRQVSRGSELCGLLGALALTQEGKSR